MSKLNEKTKNKKTKIKVFPKRKSNKEPEKVFIQKLQTKYENIDAGNITSFADFPLSPKTLKGLKECGYVKPTDIQKETLALSLQNKDILGAAQTGSGKTLAFLIPILERLFCKQWTTLDGVGAIVITPTRELAYQIFETLRRIGEHHDFSAGLIIGGKDLKFERHRMDQCNIIICTPGRLLQHMDENPLFDCVNMQILVLDEADRCLDMGFQQSMNAIIANLPLKRQTLLFSATQTKSVKDLARLSLKDPCYISVHENAKFSTPSGLQQSYVLCELKDKLSILWSFIKNHLKQKIIIFLSSCKQVKYMNEIFSKLRPGTSLIALYGTLHQLRRMEIYESFCRKSAAVLFATDIAARGLDFPEVNWVVQADCPEDADTYIHRVGRTARFHKGGESLLLLLHSEVAMVDDLEAKKIPIEKIEINPTRLNNPIRKFEAYLASNTGLKESAKRAFVSYAKSVFLMKNKKIFNVESLDTDGYANSLGLAIPPRIRFLQRLNSRKNNQVPKKKANDDSSNHIEAEVVNSDSKKLEDNISSDSGVSGDEEVVEDGHEKPVSSFQALDESDSDNEFLQVKRKDHDIELPSEFEMEENNRNKNKKKKPLTRAAVAKKILKKKIVPNKKIIFNEEGEALSQDTKEKKSDIAQLYENEDVGGINIEQAKLVLKEEDKFDKQLFKAKVKAKHKETKRKLKELKKKQEDEEKDEFGETSSDEEPDLSWVPDPDKVYNNSTAEDDNDVDDNLIGSSDVQQETNKRSKKRKIKHKEKGPDVQMKKKSKKQKMKEISSSLSVTEAEELALMLLRK